MSYTISSHCEKCGSELDSFLIDDTGLLFVTPCEKGCKATDPDLTQDWENLDYDLLEEI